ncbi:xanthine dehydrogenase accessory factor [Natronincola peptidivorans]|uniref:Xanthine dehydrogenase accessory factor n=1 Tax=Natronincola peptidivorans TaxID=426128 RepID=A0A1I0ENB7_9FIRM|nr:selenium-dependent molybdenum cofactor biosynthesis protein YqeB [Natronincola peptidivorans]SET46946.1 xanthine dehydrogenase accessory factor [Natronincola peptidivorans]
MRKNIAVIRGGGDLGTAIAHKLHRSGFHVLILEAKHPLTIRRRVAFAEAIFHGKTEIEGVKAAKVEGLYEIIKAWEDNIIPMIIDEDCCILKEIPIDIMIDAIMAKRNTGTSKDMAPITIAIGPGFEAGIDVDAVIETNRGHHLGKLIFTGFAEADTGVPGEIMGHSSARVIKAPCTGIIKVLCDIGETVKKEQVIAYIEEEPIKATIDGVIRGMIFEKTVVTKSRKIADIDPRGCTEYCYTISDKARAIAGGVLEAIFYLKKKKNLAL